MSFSMAFGAASLLAILFFTLLVIRTRGRKQGLIAGLVLGIAAVTTYLGIVSLLLAGMDSAG